MPFYIFFIIVMMVCKGLQTLTLQWAIKLILYFLPMVFIWIDFYGSDILHLCMCAFTFHDVDQGANITLLNDTAVLSKFHRVHAVHNLLDLW